MGLQVRRQKAGEIQLDMGEECLSLGAAHTKSVRHWTSAQHLPGRGWEVAGPEGQQRQISQDLVITGIVR